MYRRDTGCPGCGERTTEKRNWTRTSHAVLGGLILQYISELTDLSSTLALFIVGFRRHMGEDPAVFGTWEPVGSMWPGYLVMVLPIPNYNYRDNQKESPEGNKSSRMRFCHPCS